MTKMTLFTIPTLPSSRHHSSLRPLIAPTSFSSSLSATPIAVPSLPSALFSLVTCEVRRSSPDNPSDASLTQSLSPLLPPTNSVRSLSSLSLLLLPSSLSLSPCHCRSYRFVVIHSSPHPLSLFCHISLSSGLLLTPLAPRHPIESRNSALSGNRHKHESKLVAICDIAYCRRKG
jgi:hypothetical protein